MAILIFRLTSGAIRSFVQNRKEMISIKAVYKIPSLKHAFLVASCLPKFCEESRSSNESRKCSEFLEHILNLKEHVPPEAISRWTLKVVSETDFLSSIHSNSLEEKTVSSQSSQFPEKIELLSMNISKDYMSENEKNLNTTKVLGFIPDEDIIEIFI